MGREKSVGRTLTPKGSASSVPVLVRVPVSVTRGVVPRVEAGTERPLEELVARADHAVRVVDGEFAPYVFCLGLHHRSPMVGRTRDLDQRPPGVARAYRA
jgi:hypothetical protein